MRKTKSVVIFIAQTIPRIISAVSSLSGRRMEALMWFLNVELQLWKWILNRKYLWFMIGIVLVSNRAKRERRTQIKWLKYIARNDVQVFPISRHLKQSELKILNTPTTKWVLVDSGLGFGRAPTNTLPSMASPTFGLLLFCRSARKTLDYLFI